MKTMFAGALLAAAVLALPACSGGKAPDNGTDNAALPADETPGNDGFAPVEENLTATDGPAAANAGAAADAADAADNAAVPTGADGNAL